MSSEKYHIAKQMFLNGKSLRSIEKETGIDRKRLSVLLRKDGVRTEKGISDQIFKEILADYKKGMTMTAIALKFEVDRHTINKELKKRGYETKKNISRDTSKDAIIEELYIDCNLSIQSIATQLNVSTNLVWLSLVERGLNDSNRLSCKYEYNDVFDGVNNEEEAYWLGFLYADGYISKDGTKCELTLKESDREHVERFNSFIRKGGEVSLKNVNGNLNYRCIFSNKQIVERLISLGCHNNKTFSIKFPTAEIVPSHLMRHFIRGFFEADGCIHRYGRYKHLLSFSISCANESFIKDFQDYICEQLPISRNKISYHRNLYCIYNAAQKDIYYLYHYLYDNSTVFLKRKNDLFKDIEKLYLPS